jgi:uncharacterized protein (TIGR04255 family)
MKKSKLQRPTDLPDFDRPPVVEVVLSVQFSELRAYRTQHAGLLWDKTFRETFKNVSEHPPLDAAFETFGASAPGKIKFELLQVPGPDVPRLWFVSDDDSELIQFQANRFTHNWRDAEKGPDYPRYEVLKDRFLEELQSVSEFLAEENIGQIEPNQCEVTYVNLISFEDGTDLHTQPDLAIHPLGHIRDPETEKGAWLPELEDAQYSARYILRQEGGEPAGRLVVSLAPLFAEENKKVLRLQLTARGAPLEPNIKGVSAFFDIGREAIVRGFTALTTPQMHKHWGRNT